MKLNELRDEVHATAKEKGWWIDQTPTESDTPDTGMVLAGTPEKICLMHSELSEALECYRNGERIYWEKDGKPEGVATELADCIIRILDYCGAVGIDIEAVVEKKHAYNKTRPYRHGGKRV